MDRIKKYLLLFLCLTSTITLVKCDGEMIILKNPGSLKFHGNRALYSSELVELFKQILGYPVELNQESVKLEVVNPFGLNEQSLFVGVVHGASSLNASNIDERYAVKEDNPLQKLYDQIKELSAQENDYKLMPSVDRMTSNSLEANTRTDNVGPRVLWKDFYAPIGQDTIMNTINDLQKSVGKQILAIVISTDDKLSEPHERLKRQSEEKVEPAVKVEPAFDIKSLNLADDYDENFPVIFNIMLWFSLALIFAVIAICMVIANMDPGRDSIIYRMTSTRMKKDN